MLRRRTVARRPGGASEAGGVTRPAGRRWALVAAAGVAITTVPAASGHAEALRPIPSITHEFAGNHLHGLAYVPGEGLYLATHYGLFLLREGELYQVGEVRDDLMGFSRHPDEPDAFYASGHPALGGNFGVIVSRDGGASWEQIFTGVDEEVVDFHSMVASPADPERLYGVFAGSLYVGDVGAGEWWIAAADGITLEGYCWGAPCLAAAAGDRDRLFAGTPEGIFVSDDAGESWRRLAAETGAVAGVGADPEDPDILLAHTEAHGVALSGDGGGTWTARDAGIALGGQDFIFGFAFDPETRGRAFAASVHGLVFATEDAGESWRVVLTPAGPPQ